MSPPPVSTCTEIPIPAALQALSPGGERLIDTLDPGLVQDMRQFWRYGVRDCSKTEEYCSWTDELNGFSWRLNARGSLCIQRGSFCEGQYQPWDLELSGLWLSIGGIRVNHLKVKRGEDDRRDSVECYGTSEINVLEAGKVRVYSKATLRVQNLLTKMAGLQIDDG